jgi:hypothetical protein
MSAHAQHTQHIREIPNNRDVIRTSEVVEERELGPETGIAHQQFIVARLVWFLAGILLTLLAFRFVFAALGANPGNAFVNFIYTTSHPFVTPFFGLFSYDPLRYGISRLEVFTLVAMVVYALVAYGLARLLTLNRHRY